MMVATTQTNGATSQDGGPVGQGDYVVQQGDCISSIAMVHGHFWETLWNDPGNASLKQARGNLNVLLPGDLVTIPEIRQKTKQGATEMRHRFRRRGEPSRLRLRFLKGRRPRAGQPYRVDVDGGQTIEGALDDDGRLDVGIPGTARAARIFVGPEGREVFYDIQLGATNPVSELSGVQDRLINLGYRCPREETLGDSTRAALRAFQQARGLQPTGELDDATRQALEDAHGS